VIRRLIRRTLLISATLFGVGLIAVLIIGVLAFREPEFYASLRNHRDSDPAIEAEMDQKVREFEEWALRSVALTNRENLTGFPVQAPPKPRVSASDTYQFRTDRKAAQRRARDSWVRWRCCAKSSRANT
jgi:hypothetical protein